MIRKRLLPLAIAAFVGTVGAWVVVCGGVVPRQDYAFLLEQGVAAIFGPGTNVMEAANAILDILEGKRRNTGGEA